MLRILAEWAFMGFHGDMEIYENQVFGFRYLISFLCILLRKVGQEVLSGSGEALNTDKPGTSSNSIMRGLFSQSFSEEISLS